MADIEALKARAEGFRQKLRAIDKITGVESERSRDVARKRRDRAEAKTVFVPACTNPTRRAEMEADDERWLRYYCAELFWYSFTPQQQAMIEANGHRLTFCKHARSARRIGSVRWHRRLDVDSQCRTWQCRGARGLSRFSRL